MEPVTDLTRYRMLRQRPATDWLRWHEAWQTIVLSTIKFQFSAHRDFIRLFVR